MEVLPLRVASCSYEGALFGWDLQPTEPSEETEEQTNLLKASITFSFQASTGSFRALAISKSGKYLAVGGMNERIFIYNMHMNKAMGEIAGHSGSITHLEFFEDSFLISASEDSTMLIWRAHDWETMHILGGHKDTVLSFAIHPSGKLALSVSKDCTMRLWNLVQGKCSFTRKLKSPADLVKWHPSGQYYLLATMREIQLFDISDNSCKFNIKSSSRVNSVTFFKLMQEEEVYRLAYICDNQSLNIADMEGNLLSSIRLNSINGGRLKDIYCSINSKITDTLVVVTSEGCIAALNGTILDQERNLETSEQAEQQTKDEDLFAKALLAFDQHKGEPRLTKVVSWYPTQAIVPEFNLNPSVEDLKKSEFIQVVEEDEENNEEEEEVEEIEEPIPQKKVRLELPSNEGKKKNKDKKRKNAPINLSSQGPKSTPETNNPKKKKSQK